MMEGNAGRQPYHVGIHQQINRIDEVTGRLERLLARISKAPEKPLDPLGPDSKEFEPSLSDVLENSSERICDKVNLALDLISDVENRIF